MNRTIAAVAWLALVACQPESRERGEYGPPAEASGDVAAAPTLIDPNSATEAEVLAARGMNEAAAEALLAGRPYDDMLEVDRVLSPHLNEQQRDSVYGRLWRPLDLNTATAEEILLIPGVGPRMQQEFEEYRPYTSIAQFRREIGKYVDEAEVARLERYVTIR
jgi:DNA uptake protein ComE-like DNA-binding protein